MSLNADKASELIQAIKDAKMNLALTSGPQHKEAHERMLEQLRAVEEAYQDYLYSQKP